MEFSPDIEEEIMDQVESDLLTLGRDLGDIFGWDLNGLANNIKNLFIIYNNRRIPPESLCRITMKQLRKLVPLLRKIHVKFKEKYDSIYCELVEMCKKEGYGIEDELGNDEPLNYLAFLLTEYGKKELIEFILPILDDCDVGIDHERNCIEIFFPDGENRLLT